MRSPTLRFSFDLSHFNGEIVGGSMFSPAEGVDRLLLLPSECWEERRAGGIEAPQSASQHRNTIGEQLQRWRFSENRLRPGNEIGSGARRSGSDTLGSIASIVAVLLIQAVLISILLQEHRRRRFAEVQSTAAHDRTCSCQSLCDRWRN